MIFGGITLNSNKKMLRSKPQHFNVASNVYEEGQNEEHKDNETHNRRRRSGICREDTIEDIQGFHDRVDIAIRNLPLLEV